MPTYLPKLNLKNLDKSGATDGYVATWSDALGMWVASPSSGGAVTLRGGDASTTTWASTMSGGGADAEYAPYQILRGGDASGS